MKYAICLCIILSVVLWAQDARPSGDYDWIMENERGLVIAVESDSICYEEMWLYPAPGGGLHSDEESLIDFDELEAPFYAEITYYCKKPHHYVASLRVIRQLRFDDRNHVIGMENIDTR
jgi:hypothetical protein